MAVALSLVLAAAACGGSKPSASAQALGSGPAALLAGPVTGGKGIYLISPTPIDLSAAGYTESEYFASGTAQAYTTVGSVPANGHWTVKPSTRATYKTRIIVRTPTDPAKFNGTVLVEWLNVTGGLDVAADFDYTAPEILREGFAWVGVSVQQIAVSGGASPLGISGAPKGGLVGTDPARYGTLHHPGDQYAFDMFSQIGRALISGSSSDPLHSLHPQRFIAMGESQSAFALTTYIDAIQPRDHVYDGFFVHSRGGGSLPLNGSGIGGGTKGNRQIRTDVGVPVLMVETETDEAYLGYFFARQSDSTDVRLWDVAGASHVDGYLVGGSASILGCKSSINQAPTHFVLNSALSHLAAWVKSGAAPPSQPRIDVVAQGTNAVIQRDHLGVAIGGIRSPAVLVPVAAYSGIPAAGSTVTCSLFGSTTYFPARTLDNLYGSKAGYESRFTAATDQAIKSGAILPADRSAVLAWAGPVRF